MHGLLIMENSLEVDLNFAIALMNMFVSVDTCRGHEMCGQHAREEFGFMDYYDHKVCTQHGYEEEALLPHCFAFGLMSLP